MPVKSFFFVFLYARDTDMIQAYPKSFPNSSSRSPATYANWEQGRAEPDLETLKKLSTLYDATINQLLGLADRDLILTSRDQYERIVKARDILDEIIHELRVNSGIEIVGGKNRITIKKRVRK